jgi:hypothetical protein
MKTNHNHNVRDPIFEKSAVYGGSGIARWGDEASRCKHQIRRSILRKLIAHLNRRSLGMTKPC